MNAERGVPDAAAALEGARWILVETFAEDAELVGGFRTLVWERGEWNSVVVPGKEAEGVKYSDYFNSTEQVKTVPSHRVLALLRGRNEGVLRLSVNLPDEGGEGPTEPERRIAARAGIENRGRRRLVAGRDRALDVASMFQPLQDRDRGSACVNRPNSGIRVFGRESLHDSCWRRPPAACDDGPDRGSNWREGGGGGRARQARHRRFIHEPRDWADRCGRSECWPPGMECNSLRLATARLARDRQARRRLDGAHRIAADQVMVSEAGASVLRVGACGQEFPHLDVCAAPSRSPGGCRMRSRNSYDSGPGRSAYASSSTASAPLSLAEHSTRSSRIASTRWERT